MIPCTIPTPGDYTIQIGTTNEGELPLGGNIESPVVVIASSIDDIATAVTNLQSTADAIAADVDGLDGDTLVELKDQLESIETLIDSNEDVLTIPGDETANVSVGDAITGSSSGATATVESITFD